MANINSSNWTQYFVNNNQNLMHVTWSESYELTPQERETIQASLQQFQLGESSEGKHFIKLAEEYVRQSGDTEYLDALQLFIKEEQRHSRDLGRFMQQQGIPLAQEHPVDGMFRFTRHLMNLEVAIVVLLMAEVMAVTYYKALHDATQSATLRTICRQILRDEIQHLNFQMSALIKIRSRRSSIGLWMTCQIQRLLFCGVLVLVWVGHAPVYRAGGFSIGKFIHSNWSRFERTFSSLG